MNYIKGSLKVLSSYFTIWMVFAVFLLTYAFVVKSKFYVWIHYYSLPFLIMLLCLVYLNMERLAVKEKRSLNGGSVHPFKGIILGIIGFSPLILLQVVSPLVHFTINEVGSERIEHVIINALLGPLYIVIRLGNESVLAYVVASAIVPLTAMIGYMAGTYGFELKEFFYKILK